MDFLSEQEVEAVPTIASEGGEIGSSEVISEGGAAANVFSTSAQKGRQALMFESRRQHKESSEEVSYKVLVMCGKGKQETA